ncbi:TniQ family protein [Ferdinandcohnia quinoae]|uniref:TniQ family protein n=1 Tax=Fredinandcohnia quinoae TaxID=2918902 RepID=A0AAW5E7F4_9BACI|nr:TniQ family protein [Fredinandcohnia sp. SECRCQ15]MCH1627419.1 TniQ family protein [Fredinandcohnia sp. SECRCQ15]
MLIYPKPYAQETLLSFLYRVANQNLMDNPSWIFDCLDYRYSIKLIKNMVNWLQGDELEAVANLLRIPFRQAKTLSISYDLERIGLEVRNVKKNPWFLYDKTRYCPICLREDVYQRKIWINSQSIICLEHQLFLLDKCSNCHNIINIKDIIQNICSKCNKILSYSHSSSVQNKKLLTYQRTLNNIFIENHFDYIHSWINNSITFFKALDFLSLWVAKLINSKTLSIQKDKIFFDGNVLERHHLKNYKTIDQTICLYNFTFNIIDNWPTAFFHFLELAEENEKTFISFLKYGIPKLIGTELWPISKEVTNFLATKKFNLKGKEFIRADEIKHLNSKFNGSIFHSNLIESEQFTYKGSEFNITEKSEVNKLLDEFENSYTKEEVMNYWGTSPKATFTLLNSDLIERIHCYNTGAVSTWVIPIKSINKIELQLKEKSSLHIKSPISLGNAFQWSGPHQAESILKGMLLDKIRFKLYGARLTNTLIEKRDCYYHIKENIISKGIDSGYISIRDIVFILGIKKSDVEYWMLTGRFGVLSNPGYNVPIDNFLNFTNQYITTFELSLELNRHIKQILKRHSMGKLKSISGPDYDDGKRLLFNRNEIKYEIC